MPMPPVAPKVKAEPLGRFRRRRQAVRRELQRRTASDLSLMRDFEQQVLENRARDARLDAQEMLVARCLAPNASRNVVVEEQDTYFAALNMSRYYGMSNRERITARGYAKYSKYRKRGEKG